MVTQHSVSGFASGAPTQAVCPLQVSEGGHVTCTGSPSALPCTRTYNNLHVTERKSGHHGLFSTKQTRTPWRETYRDSDRDPSEEKTVLTAVSEKAAKLAVPYL